MATGYSRTIEATWFNVKNVGLSDSSMMSVLDELAEMSREANIRRLDDGNNMNGTPFGAYAPSYKKVRKRLGLRISPPDLKRTKKLRQQIRVTNKKVFRRGGQVSLSWRLTVVGSRRKVAEALQSGKLGKASRPPRDVIGMYSPGTSQGKRDRAAILAAGKKRLALNARSQGVLLQDQS